MSVDPARFRFIIWKGSTFSKRIHLLDEFRQPKDLTGYTARLIGKSAPGGTVLLTLESPDSILLGGINGTIDLFMTDEATDALTWRNAAYTLSLTDPAGNLDFLLYGPLRVKIV